MKRGNVLIPGNPEYRHKATFVLGAGADLTTGTDKCNPLRVPQACSGRLHEVLAKSKRAAAGADIIVDINRNGSSIFAAGSLTIPAGSTDWVRTAAFSGSGVLNEYDDLTADVVQIGSAAAGGDVSVILLWLGW